MMSAQQFAASQGHRGASNLDSILNAAMDAIITINADQQIVMFNHAAEQMFRCPATSCLGQPLSQLIPNRWRLVHAKHVTTFGQTGVTTRSMQSPGILLALRADGIEFPIEATISQTEVQGQKLYTAIVRDISERVASEKQLRHYAARLQTQRLIDQAVLTTHTPAELAHHVLPLLQQVLPFPHTSILLFDPRLGECALFTLTQPDAGPAMTIHHSTLPSPYSTALSAPDVAPHITHTLGGPWPAPWHHILDPSLISARILPLSGRHNTLGLLIMGETEAETMGEEELETAHELAAQLSVVFQHVALFEEVRQGHARMQQLSQRLIQNQEAERRRVARELHEEIGQILAAVKMRILAAQYTTDPEVRTSQLEVGLETIEQVLHQMRTLSTDLWPAMLEDLGLGAAVRWYVNLQTGSAGLTPSVTITPLALQLPLDLATICFRVMQEALLNTINHAAASRVEVTLSQDAEALHLIIKDDGIGFDPSTAQANAVHTGALGLLVMDARVRLAGGTLTITSDQTNGTQIHVIFPYQVTHT